MKPGRWKTTCSSMELICCCQKFPVFLRPESEHTGSLTRILYTRRDLVEELARALMRGYRLRDVIIVEYCDTADASGIFRLY